MKKGKAEYLLIAAGLIILAAGLYFVKNPADPQGIMRPLPYVCIGIGCGLFGHGMGNAVSRRVMQTDPEAAKKLEIEKNDERNIAISVRAKARAFDLMTFVFGALMVAFALMGTPLTEVLLLVFAYLLVEAAAIYYQCRYQKEM